MMKVGPHFAVNSSRFCQNRTTKSEAHKDSDGLCVHRIHDSTRLLESACSAEEEGEVKLLSAQLSSEWLACYFERGAWQPVRQQGHKYRHSVFFTR